MGYSPLATETHYTAQKSGRTRSVGGVVLHHGATTSADQIIDMETSGSRQVSSHLVVKDGRRAGLVEEEFRAWSLSDAYWDSWAFTVECANESTAGWTISAASHESLAQLVADWAKRYGFYPHRNGDPAGWTVIGHREVYTIHSGSYATACPGGMDLDWITNRAQQLLAGGGAIGKEDDMAVAVLINPSDKNAGASAGTLGVFSNGRYTHLNSYGPPAALKTAQGFNGDSRYDGSSWFVVNYASDSRGSFKDFVAAYLGNGVTAEALLDWVKKNPGGTYVADWAKSTGSGGSTPITDAQIAAIAAKVAESIKIPAPLTKGTVTLTS